MPKVPRAKLGTVMTDKNELLPLSLCTLADFETACGSGKFTIVQNHEASTTAYLLVHRSSAHRFCGPCNFVILETPRQQFT
jgi:hypothetical protein